MIKLIVLDQSKFNEAPNSTLIDVCCPICNKIFQRRKWDIIRCKSSFCSGKCSGIGRRKNQTPCSNCSKLFTPRKNLKIKNPCCSRNCSIDFYKKNKNLKKVGKKIPIAINQKDFDLLRIQISFDNFNSLYNNQLVPIICGSCNTKIEKNKGIILRALNEGRTKVYCNSGCSKKQETITTNCKECNLELKIKKYFIKNNNFCSRSCSAKFHNKNKSSGCIRSKMEIFIEKKLKEKYYFLDVEPNNRILLDGLELDFYFPSLKLAIELNGITHYEPIYGTDRFTRSTESDKRKMILCYEKGIELAVIDISHIKYFKENYGLLILNEIEKILIPLIKNNYKNYF